MLCEQAKIGEDGVLAEYLQKMITLFYKSSGTGKIMV
jgi:hypothetical protein